MVALGVHAAVFAITVPSAELSPDERTGASLVWLEAGAAELSAPSTALSEPGPAQVVHQVEPALATVAPRRHPAAHRPALAPQPAAAAEPAAAEAPTAAPATTAEEELAGELEIASRSAAAEPGAGSPDEASAYGQPGEPGGASGSAAGRGAGAGHGAGAGGAIGHPPGLVVLGDPCRGYYPAAAAVDHGEVRLVVQVSSDGHADTSQVVTELPASQGFAGAARECAKRLRFRPARDAAGLAIPGRAVLALSFNRS